MKFRAAGPWWIFPLLIELSLEGEFTGLALDLIGAATEPKTTMYITADKFYNGLLDLYERP